MGNIININFRISKIVLGSILFLGITLTPWGLQTNSVKTYSAYASDAAHGKKQAEHGGGEHGAHHAPPVKYYIHWAVLLFALVRVALYLKKRFGASGHADEHHEEHAVHEEHGGHGDDDDEGGGHHGIHVVQEAKGMAALLCCLVIFLFFVEYAPSLAGYHESVSVALFKVAVKMTLGVGLTTFGILGMDEH